jgi:hypothetical protein
MTLLRQHVIPHDEMTYESLNVPRESRMTPWEVEPFDVYSTSPESCENISTSQSDVLFSNRHFEAFPNMVTIGRTTDDTSFMSNETSKTSRSSTNHALDSNSNGMLETGYLHGKVSTPPLSLFEANDGFVTKETNHIGLEAYLKSVPLENKKKNPKKRKVMRCEENGTLPPLRPLSAYNYFFRDEREYNLLYGDSDDNNMRYQRPVPMEFYYKERQAMLLQEHWNQNRNKRRLHRKTRGQISFIILSKLVGQRWKELPEEYTNFYQEISAQDWIRYRVELNEYKNAMKKPEEHRVKRDTFDESFNPCKFEF